MAKSYAEKLKDPRWQRRRLEVMERAQFKCDRCASAEKSLHVHHRYYRKGAAPWEYCDETLECLCETCHETETSRVAQLQELMAKTRCITTDEVLGFVRGCIQLADGGPAALDNYEQAYGLGRAWGVSVDLVIDAVSEGGVVWGDAIHRLSYGKHN